MFADFYDLADVASRVIDRVRRRQNLPVCQTRVPGARLNWPSLVPGIEITPGSTSVTVTCDVPGATGANTLVCWDDEAHCLAVRVARAAQGGASHDWYVELRLPATVDGEKSRSTLEPEGLLCFKAPLHDTPTSTALPLSVLVEDALSSNAPLAAT